MKNWNKKLLFAMSLPILSLSIVGCNEADKVSVNISKEADNFNVLRRVAIINIRTDKVEFEIIGKLSVYDNSNTLTILAETGEETYKKHIVKLTEWNMYVVEDLSGADVNKYKYEVNYLPESIVPITITESR